MTNDKARRLACSAESVSVIWGLEMMLRAVRAGAMTARTRWRSRLAISAENPKYVTKALVETFAKKLGT